MEKADIVWGGKARGVVQALSLADGGRIRERAVNEDPDDVTTRSYVSAGRVSNKSQAFYLAGLTAQLLQGFAQLTVCRSVVGVDADGLFKALDGVREAAAF